MSSLPPLKRVTQLITWPRDSLHSLRPVNHLSKSPLFPPNPTPPPTEGRLIHLESCYNGIWFCYKKEQSTEWWELGVRPRICERSQAQKVCTAWLCLHKVFRTDEFIKVERRLSGVGGGGEEWSGISCGAMERWGYSQHRHRRLFTWAPEL